LFDLVSGAQNNGKCGGGFRKGTEGGGGGNVSSVVFV